MKTTIFLVAYLTVVMTLAGCDMDNDRDMAPINDRDTTPLNDPTYPATPSGDAGGVDVDINTDSPAEN